MDVGLLPFIATFLILEIMGKFVVIEILGQIVLPNTQNVSALEFFSIIIWGHF